MLLCPLLSLITSDPIFAAAGVVRCVRALLNIGKSTAPTVLHNFLWAPCWTSPRQNPLKMMHVKICGLKAQEVEWMRLLLFTLLVERAELHIWLTPLCLERDAEWSAWFAQISGSKAQANWECWRLESDFQRICPCCAGALRNTVAHSFFNILQETDKVSPYPPDRYDGKKHEAGATKHDRTGAVTLFVGNLPFSVTEDKLRYLCKNQQVILTSGVACFSSPDSQYFLYLDFFLGFRGACVI